MRLTPLALGAIISVCTGGAVLAQQAPANTGERQFHGSLSVSAVYESNFARSSRAVAATRLIKPEEVTLRPQINLNIVQPFGRQAVFLSGSGGYDFHRENPRLDRRRYDVQGGYLTSLGMCQLTAVESFRAAQSDLSDLELLGAKNEVRTVGTSLSATCGRATGIVGSLSASRVENKNSAVVQRTADSDLQSLGVQLGYSHPTFGRLSATYSYADTAFPNRIIPTRPIGDGFATQSTGLLAERDFGGRLSVAAAVARTNIKREFAPIGVPQKSTSTTYSADATYRFSNRLTVKAHGDRAVRPAVRAGKLFDVVTGFEVSGRYNLGTNYSVNLGYGLNKIDSNVDTTSLLPVITNSRTRSLFGSVTYRQSERASLSLDVRHDERTANLPQFDYTSTRVGLTAEVGF